MVIIARQSARATRTNVPRFVTRSQDGGPELGARAFLWSRAGSIPRQRNGFVDVTGKLKIKKGFKRTVKFGPHFFAAPPSAYSDPPPQCEDVRGCLPLSRRLRRSIASMPCRRLDNTVDRGANGPEKIPGPVGRATAVVISRRPKQSRYRNSAHDLPGCGC